MKSTRLLLFITLLIALLSVAFFVHATCVGGDIGGAGNDTIDCTVGNPPTTDVEGRAGDDIITVDSGVVTTNNIYGEGVTPGTGNDIITNNGTVALLMGDGGGSDGNDTIINNGTATNGIQGDSFSGGTGNDVIVNNGNVSTDINGDSGTGVNNSGNDTIINNGNVAGIIAGDSNLGANTTGSDTITNNGTVGTDIYGDGDALSAGGGNDIITNNGTVNGSIYGDGDVNFSTGNDTITNGGAVSSNIAAGGGTDLVIIGANTAQVGGTIDGGAGYDTLTFSITSSDPAVLLDAAQRIAAANPAGGTITLGGHTYTWLNFEELTQLLFSLTRLNGLMDPLAVFCSLNGGVDVYVISGQQGVFSLHVSTQTISNGLAQVVDSRLQIGASSTSSAYVLPTGELEVTAPNGFSFRFVYQNYCGSLPEPQPITQASAPEEVLPPYSIINQPYGG